MRIGFGYDIHRLTPDRPLILGGVRIDHSVGLEGHSDADCLIHAIMDALLGASGHDDIGVYFPDTDEAFKNIASVKLLTKVCTMVREKGYEICNIDTVLLAERPKIAPYKEHMRACLATALKIEPERINIKATTSEGVGYVGREEAIAAYAVVLLNNAKS